MGTCGSSTHRRHSPISDSPTSSTNQQEGQRRRNPTRQAEQSSDISQSNTATFWNPFRRDSAYFRRSRVSQPEVHRTGDLVVTPEQSSSRNVFAFDDDYLDSNTTNVAAAEVEDIETLVQELRVMETLFHSLFGGQQGNVNGDFVIPPAWMHAPADGGGGGPPPISDRAMRQLPNVVVTNYDLLDEANRECCICFADINLGDRLTRLPCGHLYHRPCISQWLRKHCTCPVCRYELETDDPTYERGRVERMALRKPRYHKYELERMTIRELHDLMRRIHLLDRNRTATEKSELVDFILNSGKIDVISVAQPVASTIPQFRISELRSLGIGKLKKTMADSGVFFDPVDVVEKEDMVQIFVNSGRVNLLSEENNFADVVVQELPASDDLQPVYPQQTHVEESEREDEWELVDATDSSAFAAPTTEISDQPVFISESVDANVQGDVVSLDQTVLEASVNTEHTLPGVHNEPQRNVQADIAMEDMENVSRDRHTSYASSSSDSTLSSYSISQLRQLAYQLNVSLSGCLERSEMVDRIASAAATRQSET